MLHDGDYVFDDKVQIFENWFIEQGPLYSNLIKNREFRRKLAGRLRELGETAFSERNVKQHLESGKWDESELKNAEDYLLERKNTIQTVINEINK